MDMKSTLTMVRSDPMQIILFRPTLMAIRAEGYGANEYPKNSAPSTVPERP